MKVRVEEDAEHPGSRRIDRVVGGVLAIVAFLYFSVMFNVVRNFEEFFKFLERLVTLLAPIAPHATPSTPCRSCRTTATP